MTSVTHHSYHVLKKMDRRDRHMSLMFPIAFFNPDNCLLSTWGTSYDLWVLLYDDCVLTDIQEA